MTRHLDAILRLAVFALALGVGACAESTAPRSGDEALLADLAIVAADATLEDVALWRLPLGFSPGLAPAPPGGGSGWPGAFSVTRRVTFYDADGVEQNAYHPLRTDVIRILYEVLGKVTRENWSASVHRLRELEVSGLAGTETRRTWNGSGSEEVSRKATLADGVRSYDAVGSFTYQDVVVPVFGTEPRYPVSGTITRKMTVTRSGLLGERTRTVDIVITFDGDSTATAVIDGKTVEIDLTTPPGRLPFWRSKP
jgi:hypothetical protein